MTFSCLIKILKRTKIFKFNCFEILKKIVDFFDNKGNNKDTDVVTEFDLTMFGVYVNVIFQLTMWATEFISKERLNDG